jgi:Holliday junction resolvase
MRKSSYQISQKQELDLAKLLEGHTIARSGAGIQKGDVRKPGVVRVEAKVTRRRSFSVTKDILNKLALACSAGEQPVLAVRFIQGDQVVREVFVVDAPIVESYTGKDVY